MEKSWLARYPAGTPAEISLDSGTSLVDVLRTSCERFAAKPAFHNMGTTLTYAEVDDRSRDFAAWLSANGLRPGDRIALMMPNLLQYPIVMFGALRAGLVIVNTNPLYTPRELAHQLRDSGALCIVVLANFAHVVQAVLPKTSVRHVIVTQLGDLLHLAGQYADAREAYQRALDGTTESERRDRSDCSARRCMHRSRR